MLTPAAIVRVRPIVRARIGRNAALADILIANINAEGEANLAAVLEALYPGQDREKAQANLPQLRLEIAKAAAKKPEVKFVLEGDTKTRSAPEERTVCFEGEDRAAENLDGFNRPNSKRIELVWIPRDAIKQRPRRVRHRLRRSRQNRRRNANRTPPSPLCQKAEVKIWTDAQILLGEKERCVAALTRSRIHAASGRCQRNNCTLQ